MHVKQSTTFWQGNKKNCVSSERNHKKGVNKTREQSTCDHKNNQGMSKNPFNLIKNRRYK